MRVLFTREGWADHLFWQEQDRTVLRRVNELIRDAQRDPFRGIGKPEPLRGDLQGWWSRRIAGDHRLVSRVVGVGNEQRLEVVACRYRYSRRG
jgi:toxin YoeB